MQEQPNPDRKNGLKFLDSDQAKRLNFLADTDMYEMAIKFAREDDAGSNLRISHYPTSTS